jgi:hypothetical protein
MLELDIKHCIREIENLKDLVIAAYVITNLSTVLPEGLTVPFRS